MSDVGAKRYFVTRVEGVRPDARPPVRPIGLRRLVPDTRLRPTELAVAVGASLMPDEVRARASGAVHNVILYVGGVAAVTSEHVEVHVFERPSGRELHVSLPHDDVIADVPVFAGDEVFLHTWDEVSTGGVPLGRAVAVITPPQLEGAETLLVELDALIGAVKSAPSTKERGHSAAKKQKKAPKPRRPTKKKRE